MSIKAGHHWLNFHFSWFYSWKNFFAPKPKSLSKLQILASIRPINHNFDILINFLQSVSLTPMSHCQKSDFEWVTVWKLCHLTFTLTHTWPTFLFFCFFSARKFLEKFIFWKVRRKKVSTKRKGGSWDFGCVPTRVKSIWQIQRKITRNTIFAWKLTLA